VHVADVDHEQVRASRVLEPLGVERYSSARLRSTGSVHRCISCGLTGVPALDVGT
jgi:DNA-directed RNA polymerase subunit N (RpoN/RPB10)